MYHQVAVQPQSLDVRATPITGMRLPPAGTVPTDYTPYPQAQDAAAVNSVVNPLPVTMPVMRAGQKYFNTYCIVCHGPRGDGLGYVVPYMTQPPPIFAPDVLSWSDGRLFQLVTNGQNHMPPYRTELDASQRWAIVHYLRALQLAANPQPEMLQLAAQKHLSLDDDFPPALTRNGYEPGQKALPQP
jgi:mono/diheme cytochrome c family protein